MSLIEIDRRLCQRDGACVDECPRLLIEQLDPDAYPTEIADADALCINCGHCVAVCPSGALALKTMSPVDCQPVMPDVTPGPAQVDGLLRTRRSIRTFKNRPVPREVLARLIDVARYAPTGSNSQSVEWLIVHDGQEVRRLAKLTEDHMRAAGASATYATTLIRAAEAGLDLICRGAPHVVVAHTPTGTETNGVIALTYLELAAYSLGLGACWAGFFTNAAKNWAPMRDAIGLPAGRAVAGALLLGYPTYHYKRVPLRDPARVVWR